MPDKDCLRKVAEIISWNLWQMDGLKYGIPGYTPTELFKEGLFKEEVPVNERFCRIMEWKSLEPLKGDEVVFAKMLNTNK